MRTLIETRFAEGAFPKDWEVSVAELSSEAGGIRSKEYVRFQFLLPEAGGDTVRVELEIEPLGATALECTNADLVVAVQLSGFRYPRHFVLKNSMHLLGESAAPAKGRRGSYRVAAIFSRDCVAGEVEGETLVSAIDPHPRPSGRVIGITLWGPVILHGLRVMGTEGPTVAHPVPPSEKDFFLEHTVDWHGYMIVAPFTRQMVGRLFAEFASWGVRRVHWIHYGSRAEGLWEHSGWGTEAHAAKTFDQVGDMMAAAVEAAHAHRLEIFGLIKPFDMFGARFLTEHPELRLARKPGAHGPPVNETVTRIDLVKEDDLSAEITAGDLQIFVSDDNRAYRTYSGPVRREETVEDYPRCVQTPSGVRVTSDKRRTRVLRLSGLEIREKYVALRVEGRTGSFSNRLMDLLRVYGERGEETRLTYGFMPKRPHGAPAKSFVEDGVFFDWSGETPSSVFPGFDRTTFPHALDGRHGFLAFMRGKEAHALSVLSPAFPEVRAWWLSWVKHILDAGADGVEIRMRNHNDHFAWSEFGFEPPVRDEFMRRHGVDIWATDDFDRAALRRLRGEFYTHFLRDAKALTQQRGKKLGLHISVSKDMEPEQGAAMEIHWDWRRWIEEGLPDSVTLKEVWPVSRFADEVLAMTRPRGIPAIHSPYNHDVSAAALAGQIRNARAAGCAGFQQYNPLVRGLPDGTIAPHQNAGQGGSKWIKVLREHFAKQP